MRPLPNVIRASAGNRPAVLAMAAVLGLALLVPCAPARAQDGNTATVPVQPDTGPDGPAVTAGDANTNAGAQQGPQEPPPDSPWWGGQNMMLFLLIGGMILLFWLSSRSRRKQEQKQKEMLASLKKGDKVTSIGGIMGTIIEIKDNEVVVKVDEQNNVRMRFLRSAIRGVGEAGKNEPESR